MSQSNKLAKTLTLVREYRRDAAGSAHAAAKRVMDRAEAELLHAETAARSFDVRRSRAEALLRACIANGTLDPRLLVQVSNGNLAQSHALREVVVARAEERDDAACVENDKRGILNQCERRVSATTFFVQHLRREHLAEEEKTAEMLAEEIGLRLPWASVQGIEA